MAQKRKKTGKKKTGQKKPGELVDAYKENPEFFRDPMIGRTLGKSKIEKLLGEGRTAVVYRANYEPLKRTVALKVLQKSMQKHPGVVRVFQQEGRAVAALDHENVVKIYDVGEDQGEYYIVLELLRGKDLRKKIDGAGDDGLPVDEALEYARQTAAGLAAASRKNLVHRDIKPQNLVIEPDGTVKIVDFGLAAEAEGAFAGGRLGTPHYMAPEVCRGEQAQTASDVYSLGITLFHMLTGRPPYQGRKTTEEILDGHLKGERLQPEAGRTDIPKAVADLVRRMTRKDPAVRPSAAEVAKLIAEKLTPERLGARKRLRAGGARRGRAKSSSAMPLAIGGGAIVLLGVVGFFVFGGSGDDEPKDDDGKAKVVAEKPAENAGDAKKPDRPKRPKRDDATRVADQKVRELLRSAQAAEKKEELEVAQGIYTQVLTQAPAGSKASKAATAALKRIKETIEKEAGGTQSERRKKVIRRRESADAGKEFLERRPEIFALLKTFQISKALEEFDGFRQRTREDSDERKTIEEWARKLGYIRSLISIMEARGGALQDERAEWFTYDPETEEDLRILSISEKGVELRDEAQNATRVRPWIDISVDVRIALLEACRNPRNATETLWVAYWCRLAGSDKAERYFDLANRIDKSQPIRELAKELRAD